MRMDPSRLSLVIPIAGALLLPACTGTPDDAGGGDAGGAPAMSCGAETVRTPRRLRRLTRFEYDNTVNDLLHLDTHYGRGFPPDDVVGGFDNNGAALRVGPLLADKLRVAAEGLAESALANPGAIHACAAQPNAGLECGKQLIPSLLRRAFRRPPGDGETARYLALFTGLQNSDGFKEALRAVIEAVLQSPNFLYRTELGAGATGGAVPLTDHEVAASLSYLFWSSMPDDELLAAADAGMLRSADAVAAQARRLLASPRSRPMLDHFAAQWLELDKIDQVTKDAKYADFTPAIRQAMRAETEALVDHVVRSGGTLADLITSPDSWIKPELAAFYGVKGPPKETLADGSARYDVSAAHRGGLLTHGVILASHAKPDSASPVHRGKLVREKLLCGLLPPPPAGLNLQLAPVDPNQSNRERFTQHDQNPACAGCHAQIDRIGFGFERWDAVGRYMESDNGHAIDDSGEIVSTLSTNGTFHGVTELSSMLAKSGEVAACFARQWVRYGYGVDESRDTDCLIERATRDFASGSYRVDELLVSLVLQPDFRTRRADGEVPAADLGVTPLLDGGAPSPDLSTAPPDLSMPGLSVSAHEDSRWQSGYCEGVLVTNHGDHAVEWEATLPVEGKINNLWNAAQQPAGGGLIRFTGLVYNHSLEPGATVSFGWCAATM